MPVLEYCTVEKPAWHDSYITWSQIQNVLYSILRASLINAYWSAQQSQFISNSRVRAFLIYNRHPLSICFSRGQEKNSSKAGPWMKPDFQSLICTFKTFFSFVQNREIATHIDVRMNINFSSDKTSTLYRQVTLYQLSLIISMIKICQFQYNFSVWLQGKLFCIFHFQ